MLLPRHTSFNLVFILYYVTNIDGILLRTAPKYPESYYTDSLSDEEPLVAVAIVDADPFLKTENNDSLINLISQKLTPKISKKRNIYDNYYDDVSDTDEDETTEEDLSNLKLTPLQKTMLRKKWRSNCDKQAAKTCTKACNMARKNVCSDYLCKKGLGKRFKKECERCCNSLFIGSSTKNKATQTYFTWY